ncbi:MAG: CBS domain-containing protein [Actinomycetota bacterium]
MNARAAWRLESLGVSVVYRYAAGKADWLAAGLPTEGTASGALRAGSVVRRNPPTCRPEDPAGTAQRAAAEIDRPVCLVVNQHGVVVGRLRGERLRTDERLRVEEIMEEGPTTIRANEDLAKLVERMQRRKVGSIVVTDPDGRLIGILYRDDAERALEVAHASDVNE